ncbi:hypothetical protein [Haliangium ochraceum]|uniref:Lipoprotein n=1 Tax=Haliangium ochraceum (strain DSM 14365 / JCM 11303 / SMP-2) TaxID=502025 RepID=D0LT61_HALO1|nr:hypothetical protein [Haliangium ochraceum]ACY19197.1 hypothetical protein Hoch_6733 [Haliangium ochraceum DSM 14365]
MPCITWKRVGQACFALLLGSAMIGCSDTPSAEQCEKLLDHVVDLQLQEAGQGKEMPAEMRDAVKKQKDEVAGYVRESFMSQCTEELSSSFVECALAAKDATSYGNCTKE